jgi:hypothetical protein
MAGAIDKESKMKFIVCAATLVFLLWGTPALAGPCVDTDGDLVCDVADNCTLVANAAQTDTDGDDCGNVCDYDVKNSNEVSTADIFQIVPLLATGPHPQEDLTVPIGDVISTADIFVIVPVLAGNGGSGVSGPSGTTAGTALCP